jgi:hypothetical protein
LVTIDRSGFSATSTSSWTSPGSDADRRFEPAALIAASDPVIVDRIEPCLQLDAGPGSVDPPDV